MQKIKTAAVDIEEFKTADAQNKVVELDRLYAQVLESRSVGRYY